MNVFVSCVFMVRYIHDMETWFNWGRFRVRMWCWVVVCKFWCFTVTYRCNMQDINVRVISICGEMLVINDIVRILHCGD